MCIRVSERYSICGCIYYSHAIDTCPAWENPNHQVREKEVLVGYTCSHHASSAVESRSGITKIRNTRSAWEQDFREELVIGRCDARHPKTGERCKNFVAPHGNPKNHRRANGSIFADKLGSNCPYRLPARAEPVGSSPPSIVQPIQATTHREPSIALTNLGEPQPETLPIPQQQHFRSIRPCHILLFLGALTIVGSLTFALWRAVEFDDLSGGFTLAQYILGVGVFVTGSMTAIHSKNCTCWRRGSEPSGITAGPGSGDRP